MKTITIDQAYFPSPEELDQMDRGLYRELYGTKPINMPNYQNLYVVTPAKKVPLDQLIQLLRIVSDGDLISKSDRDHLVDVGYANKVQGFNIITVDGIAYLRNLGRLAS